MQQLADERALRALQDACEVADVRARCEASDERLQGITLVNKDLLAQLALVHEQWQAAATQARAREVELAVQLEATRRQAEAEAALAVQREATARLEAKHAREEAERALQVATAARATALQQESSVDAATRAHSSELASLQQTINQLQLQMADGQADQSTMRKARSHLCI